MLLDTGLVVAVPASPDELAGLAVAIATPLDDEDEGSGYFFEPTSNASAVRTTLYDGRSAAPAGATDTELLARLATAPVVRAPSTELAVMQNTVRADASSDIEEGMAFGHEIGRELDVKEQLSAVFKTAATAGNKALVWRRMPIHRANEASAKLQSCLLQLGSRVACVPSVKRTTAVDKICSLPDGANTSESELERLAVDLWHEDKAVARPQQVEGKELWARRLVNKFADRMPKRKWMREYTHAQSR